MNGLNYFLDGYRLIFQSGLKRYVIIPLMINIFLFAGMFLLSKHYFAELNHWIQSLLPHWLMWLSQLLWVIFFISFFLVMVYTFVTLANLVSAPFNSLLAEKVEFYLTGKKLEERSYIELCKDIPRIIWRQLQIIGYYIPRAIVLLILFFIPIIQIVAAVFWFLFNAWFMALQYVDYPTDNHRIPLNEVRSRLKQKRRLTLEFGITILVASMIPFINLFVVPAAVASATKLWIQEHKS